MAEGVRYVVQLMIVNDAVWRKSCRNAIENQKGEPGNKPCILCGEVGKKRELRRAATRGLDKKVRE